MRPANVANTEWDVPDRSTNARVGDLVLCRLLTESHRERMEVIGQIVRQTDIMSEVISIWGSHLVRTNSLVVVQPGHPRDTHSTGGGQRA